MSRRRNYISTNAQHFWNPTKDKDGNKRTEATEQDFIEGIYRGSRVTTTKNGESTLHQISAEQVGTPDGVEGYDEGEEPLYEFWGTQLINDDLASIPKGTPIFIQWQGLAQPKKEGGRPYHSWNIEYDPTALEGDPNEAPQEGSEPAKGEPAQEVSQEAQSEEKGSSEEDDDYLPF